MCLTLLFTKVFSNFESTFSERKRDSMSNYYSLNLLLAWLQLLAQWLTKFVSGIYIL